MPFISAQLITWPHTRSPLWAAPWKSIAQWKLTCFTSPFVFALKGKALESVTMKFGCGSAPPASPQFTYPCTPESTNTTSQGTDRLPRATLGGSLLYWGGQTPAAQHQGSLELFLCLFQGHGWAENDSEWGLGSTQEGVG